MPPPRVAGGWRGWLLGERLRGAIGELLRQTLTDLGGRADAGELGVREEARGLVLPTAIFARWSRD